MNENNWELLKNIHDLDEGEIYIVSDILSMELKSPNFKNNILYGWTINAELINIQFDNNGNAIYEYPYYYMKFKWPEFPIEVDDDGIITCPECLFVYKSCVKKCPNCHPETVGELNMDGKKL